MNIFGLSFVLWFIKLSAGYGFWKTFRCRDQKRYLPPKLEKYFDFEAWKSFNEKIKILEGEDIYL